MANVIILTDKPDHLSVLDFERYLKENFSNVDVVVEDYKYAQELGPVDVLLYDMGIPRSTHLKNAKEISSWSIPVFAFDKDGLSISPRDLDGLAGVIFKMDEFEGFTRHSSVTSPLNLLEKYLQ